MVFAGKERNVRQAVGEVDEEGLFVMFANELDRLVGVAGGYVVMVGLPLILLFVKEPKKTAELPPSP